MAATSPVVEQQRDVALRTSEVHIEYTDGKGFIHRIVVELADGGRVTYKQMVLTPDESRYKLYESWDYSEQAFQ